MVKLQTKTIRKRHVRGKNEYSYKKHILPFPIKEKPVPKPEIAPSTNQILNKIFSSQAQRIAQMGACLK